MTDFILQSYTPPAGNSVNFDLSVEEVSKYGLANFGTAFYGGVGEEPVLASPFFLGLGLSGKLGNPGEPDPLNVKGIYQMRMTKRGKVPIKMKFYTPTNPQTEAQQANRAKFASAMSAWQALTPTQKEEYSDRARKRNMFGWGLFIREYYQAN